MPMFTGVNGADFGVSIRNFADDAFCFAVNVSAYFDAILNILRVHYIDDSVSEDTRIAAVPSTYAHTWNGVLHKWKGMFKGYSEVDVCLECSEFFQDDYAHLEKCPNCPNEARYEEGKTVNRVHVHGRARSIFLWWSLETLFTIFFLTPELAMLACTWWKE
eukprot:gene4224-5203_t